MRVKKPEIMERIIAFANEFRREYGRSPSTAEIGAEVGVAKGTAYTYLTRMHELGMIRYDGKDIITNLSERINKAVNNTPIVGRVVCGDPTQEEETVEEYVDLPTSIFGSGELFILQAYGDASYPVSRSEAYLRFNALKKRSSYETDSGMARTQRFQHNGKYLCSLGLRSEPQFCTGNAWWNEQCIKRYPMRRRHSPPLHIVFLLSLSDERASLQAIKSLTDWLFLAEAVGFEPTGAFTRLPDFEF